MTWTDDDFKALYRLGQQVGAHGADLLACMNFESRLNPTETNTVSGAYGLIQWTPIAYEESGIANRAAIPPTVSGQLPLAARYFQSKKRVNKATYGNAGDVYQAIFAPGYFPATSDSTVWYRAPGNAYEQNKSLDTEKKGYITRGDAVSRVRASIKSSEFAKALGAYQQATGDYYGPNFGSGSEAVRAIAPNEEVSKAGSLAALATTAMLASGLLFYTYRVRPRRG